MAERTPLCQVNHRATREQSGNDPGGGGGGVSEQEVWGLGGGRALSKTLGMILRGE